MLVGTVYSGKCRGLEDMQTGYVQGTEMFLRWKDCLPLRKDGLGSPRSR